MKNTVQVGRLEAVRCRRLQSLPLLPQLFSTVTPDDADNMVVEGTVTLDRDLEATLTGGPFIVGTQYTLVQANGGLNSTTFSNVSITSPPGINPQVMYDTNHVYLVIEPAGTPTVTPTTTPRPTPTPRSRPAPHPRPTPH